MEKLFLLGIYYLDYFYLFYMLLSLHRLHLFSATCVSIARLSASGKQEPCLMHLGTLLSHDRSLDIRCLIKLHFKVSSGYLEFYNSAYQVFIIWAPLGFKVCQISFMAIGFCHPKEGLNTMKCRAPKYCFFLIILSPFVKNTQFPELKE